MPSYARIQNGVLKFSEGLWDSPAALDNCMTVTTGSITKNWGEPENTSHAGLDVDTWPGALPGTPDAVELSTSREDTPGRFTWMLQAQGNYAANSSGTITYPRACGATSRVTGLPIKRIAQVRLLREIEPIPVTSAGDPCGQQFFDYGRVKWSGVATGWLENTTDAEDLYDDAAPAAYNAGTTYSKGNSVTYSTKRYVSIADSNTGNTPADTGSAFWYLVDDNWENISDSDDLTALTISLRANGSVASGFDQLVGISGPAMLTSITPIQNFTRGGPLPVQFNFIYQNGVKVYTDDANVENPFSYLYAHARMELDNTRKFTTGANDSPAVGKGFLLSRMEAHIDFAGGKPTKLSVSGPLDGAAVFESGGWPSS